MSKPKQALVKLIEANEILGQCSSSYQDLWIQAGILVSQLEVKIKLVMKQCQEQMVGRRIFYRYGRPAGEGKGEHGTVRSHFVGRYGQEFLTIELDGPVTENEMIVIPNLEGKTWIDSCYKDDNSSPNCKLNDQGIPI